LKSTKEDLQKRGYMTTKDIELLTDSSKEQLFELLHSKEAATRSAAASNLVATDQSSACELLTQLSEEKCLYTKIAICESLEKGDSSTAKQMTEYLGKIGNNQHKTLPNKVSEKKSFPLPRDIVARSLGKMDTSVFQTLFTILQGNDMDKIQEVLDAVGYMAFNNKNLATSENVAPILSLIKKHKDNSLVVWKALLCLSVFPLDESKKVLLQYSNRTDLIGLEAQRSLALIEKKF
jgi:hypothetical protein